MQALWYYAVGGNTPQGPVSEDEIRALIERNALKANDLLWCNEMSDWTPLRDITHFRPAAPAIPSLSPPPTPRVPAPSGLAGWMAFNGVVIILSGLAYIMSCFALPTGVLLVIAGAALMSGQSMLAGLHTVDPEWLPFLQKMRAFFQFTGIATLVAVLLTTLALVTMFAVGAASMAALFEQMGAP